MIKKLRWRLVIVSMALLNIVMVVIVSLFLGFTYEGMERDSLIALENSGRIYGLHEIHPDDELPKERPDKGPEELGKPDKRDRPKASGDFLKDKTGKTPQAVIPCFVVGYDHEGQLYAEGPGYYDLSDEKKLEQLLSEAIHTGKNSGVLSDHGMRFLSLEGICGGAYAFTDVTSELEAMFRLVIRSLLIWFLGNIGFFVICLMVSRWATRPVAQVMEQQRCFVADASHELKTPLTVILTNAELLDEGTYQEEDRAKAYRSILTMSRQMRGLVDELLLLARVEDGVPTEEKVELNLSRVAEEQVLLFEPLYFEEGRELQSQVEADLYVEGDPERLGQVMEILLDNGCKYSVPGSQVTFSLRQHGRKKCLLTVESRGDTLTAQECRDIFKRFYRRDPNRSMNHSYGLGLAIAQSVVHQHKGKIWATSREGINTFYVSLPVKRQ